MTSRDGVRVGIVALVARLAVVAWAWSRIPAAADGTYYHKLAGRLASGAGYTWLWDDGVVTYAAHYPVGYPAILAPLYALFGAHPGIAMLVNALFGVGGAVAAYVLARSVTTPRLALVAGIAVALHPALVPYTAALMTEGVTTSLLTIAAALTTHGRASSRAPSRRTAIGIGVVMGIATLVRPQSLLLAPVFGAIALGGAAARGPRAEGRPVVAGAVGAALTLVVSLAVCAPWTARNCARMDQCALVSVNGGWNLAIGAQTSNGAWQPIEVPAACKTVFQEAAKDACFGAEARKAIVAAPIGWLARVPAKVRATFDYFGAAPWYLHEANRVAFPWNAKVALGTIEVVTSRGLLSAALVALFRLREPGSSRARSRVRQALCLVGIVSCFVVPVSIGYVALGVGLLVLGLRRLASAPALASTAAVIVVTAATHAVFFGAGRYGLVVVPFVTVLAFSRSAGAVEARTPATAS